MITLPTMFHNLIGFLFVAILLFDGSLKVYAWGTFGLVRDKFGTGLNQVWSYSAILSLPLVETPAPDGHGVITRAYPALSDNELASVAEHAYAEMRALHYIDPERPQPAEKLPTTMIAVQFGNYIFLASNIKTLYPFPKNAADGHWSAGDLSAFPELYLQCLTRVDYHRYDGACAEQNVIALARQVFVNDPVQYASFLYWSHIAVWKGSENRIIPPCPVRADGTPGCDAWLATVAPNMYNVPENTPPDPNYTSLPKPYESRERPGPHCRPILRIV